MSPEGEGYSANKIVSIFGFKIDKWEYSEIIRTLVAGHARLVVGVSLPVSLIIKHSPVEVG
jgi:hypothetical protein